MEPGEDTLRGGQEIGGQQSQGYLSKIAGKRRPAQLQEKKHQALCPDFYRL